MTDEQNKPAPDGAASGGTGLVGERMALPSWDRGRTKKRGGTEPQEDAFQAGVKEVGRGAARRVRVVGMAVVFGVAAVVVGGVNTFGGSGTPIGALLGALLIDTIGQSLIRWLQISEFWRDALLGLLILLAVAADALIITRMRRLSAR